MILKHGKFMQVQGNSSHISIDLTHLGIEHLFSMILGNVVLLLLSAVYLLKIIPVLWMIRRTTLQNVLKHSATPS